MTTRPTQLRRARAAFTAVELLIVVAIVGIVAALAAPMLGSRSDLQLAAASRKMLADLTYAQNLAVSTQRSCYVRFTADQYEVCTRPATALEVATHPVDKFPFVVRFGPGGEGPLSALTLAVPDVGGTPVLAFDSLGTPQSYDADTRVAEPLAASVALTIAASDGTTTTIRVSPYTGELSVD